LSGGRERNWINLGGQLVPEKDVDRLRSDIRNGKLDSWAKIHRRYDLHWDEYVSNKQRHAFATWCAVLGTGSPTGAQWIEALDRGMAIQEYIRDQVYISRNKDYDSYFHHITFRNQEEMDAALGSIEDNSFVKKVREETEEFRERINEIKKRG
jgi:hypothetical protein